MQNAAPTREPETNPDHETVLRKRGAEITARMAARRAEWLANNPITPVEQRNAAFERIEKLVARLALRFPELGLSFGYIGNLEHGRDDRNYRVFTKLSTNLGATGCNVGYGNASIDRIGNLANYVEAGLTAWCIMVQDALNTGRMFRVR